MSTDRLPPSDLQTERTVLGCVFLDNLLAAELKPDWFFDLKHQQVCNVMQELHAKVVTIDASTVGQQLGGGVENFMLASHLSEATHTAVNFRHHAGILESKATLRGIIRAGMEGVDAAYQAGGDVSVNADEILSTFEQAVMDIRQRTTAGNSDAVDLRQTMWALTDEYENALARRVEMVPTGFSEIDNLLLGGLRPGQLFIIAARPSVGKTALALNIAEHVAVDRREPLAFFSLEMSGKELLHRLTASAGRVDGARLMRGKPVDSDLVKIGNISGKIMTAPMTIYDRGGLTLGQLAGLARRAKTNGSKLIIVDYLGLVRSGERGRSRYEETTLISQGLKQIAMDTKLPVIALAQLNRATDSEGRPPRMSDLRDSDSIEQDADIIGLLHHQQPTDGQPEGLTSKVSLLISKNRSGPTGQVFLSFRREYTRFEQVAPTNYED